MSASTSSRVINPQLERQKRELRARIARLRRQIDARAVALREEKQRLATWQTYVREFPLATMGVAFGVGLILSAGLSPRRVSRWLGASLASAAFGSLRTGLWTEIAKMWTEGLGERNVSPTPGHE